MLISYLENLASDGKIVEQASMQLDILYFLNYNIDGPLPWHSTLSRTRKLYGEELFLKVFNHILELCVHAGMVDGRIQAVDSAFIKANTSMNSLRNVRLVSRKYYKRLNDSKEKEEVQADDYPPESNDPRRQTNIKRVSHTDPDAKLSTKRGRPMALNYQAQISVDVSSHIICGALGLYANIKDSRCMPYILNQTIDNLSCNGIEIKRVLADTNYSSGDALKYLETNEITGYIPYTGNYKSDREGFIYDVKNDCYLCRMNKKLTFRYIHKSGSSQKESRNIEVL
ncbi:transposase [Bacteroides thetaiotaomicron]|nr:transposase [Bacteroides thetaiotaomicron]